MDSVLSLNNITKFYGKIRALNDVSFEVPQGSVFGILGPNGSGKTTLLSIILDVLKANNGNYLWFGHPGSPSQRKKIGSLLETPNFYHYLSGINNLKITQSISGRGTAEDIDNVLKKVRLFERRKSRFSSFSLGMKQRLAIAAALLGDPEVLVLDEPTNGLDPVGIAEIRQLIIELRNSGHTIVMASHLLDEVEKVCTHEEERGLPFGKPLRDAHPAKLFQRVWNPLFFMASWCIRSCKRFLLSAQLAYLIILCALPRFARSGNGASD